MATLTAPIQEYRRGEFLISTDRARLDVDAIHAFLTNCYWAKGIPKETTHPLLQDLRRWTLATRDAHSLYSQIGFTPLAAPDRWMERHDPNVYSNLNS